MERDAMNCRFPGVIEGETAWILSEFQSQDFVKGNELLDGTRKGFGCLENLFLSYTLKYLLSIYCTFSSFFKKLL